jgi:flagellar hook-length control protein FliK
MNAAPVQSSAAVAVDSGSTASSSTDNAGDLFALLLGSLGAALGALSDGDAGAQADSTTAAADGGADDERRDTPGSGDFSLLLSQLPGADGLGLGTAPPPNATLRLLAQPAGGSAANAAFVAAAPRPGSAATLPPAPPLATPVADADAALPFLATADLDAAAATSARPASQLAAAIGDGLELRVRGADPTAAVHSTAPAAPLVEELELTLPPGTGPKVAQAFADGMAMRVGWLAERQVGHAEIQLHPEDLGSIDVALDFDGMSLRAEFSSSNPEVRQLIESTLPRLRDMLEAQGFSLRDANVGTRSDGQGGRDGGARNAQPAATALAPAEPATPVDVAARRLPAHRGGLSEYA